ncbi:MAG: polysaccharide deacetylase family protein [Lachnospiraceae bacterium]|nr:polysaccharide deacetylase family protein [Lachnospiraceae bacterium]
MKNKKTSFLTVTIFALLLAIAALVVVIINMNGSGDKTGDTKTADKASVSPTAGVNDDSKGNAVDNAKNDAENNTSDNGSANSGTENDDANVSPTAAADNGNDNTENGNTTAAPGNDSNTGDSSENASDNTGNNAVSSNVDADPDANATVTATSLNVRKNAGTEYEKIKVDNKDFSLTANDRVRIKDVKGDWFHITFKVNGTEVDGYAYGPYIIPDTGSGFTMIAAPGSTVINIQSERYKDYDNILREWWYTRNNTHTIPTAAYSNDITRKFADYGAYYANLNATDADKVFYLTFDCGYENGYTEKILDILKAHNAKACFFVTKSYVKEASSIAKRMKDEGHIVGNHTATHPVLPKKTDEQIEEELISVEELFKEKTGYDLDHYMRPPQGDFSERTLKIQQDLGYKTIFWSLAIANDWDLTKQNSIDPFGTIKAGHHSGCIALIHAVSSANTAALNDILTYLENEGYRFGTLDELQ